MKPMNFLLSVLYTGVPMLLLLITTHLFIPFFSEYAGTREIIAWYIGSLFLLFLPMFIASLIFFSREKKKGYQNTLTERFRLHLPGRNVILWSAAGVIAALLLTLLFIRGGEFVYPEFSAQPGFMNLSPLGEGEMWILAAWIPMFIFNILGEAFYWRGYIFPRQELAFGRYTWLIHGFFWWIFHISMGLSLLYTLIPVIFITSWLVQKTRSTWTDIIIHASVNGTGFILVAFGIVT
jgi:membrane protease YdiL (CAAX protease family)